MLLLGCHVVKGKCHATGEVAAYDLSRTILQHLRDAFVLRKSGSLKFDKALQHDVAQI
jgi:hypothetical protein